MTKGNKTEDFEAFYSRMDEYNLIQVEKNDSLVFMISGIARFRNPANIGFTRTFADTIVLPGSVASIDEDSNTIYYEDDKYVLCPVREKPTTVSSLPQKIGIETLLSKDYLSDDYIIASGNTVYAPISLSKLGVLTKAQNTSIKRTMEKYLDAAQIKYQYCRIPAFSIEYNENDYIIYGHIHSLENNKNLNKIMLYSSADDLNEKKMFDKIALYLGQYIKQSKNMILYSEKY